MTAVYIAVTAFVYVDILTSDGMIFGRVHDFCETHLPSWVHKPLITCAYCFGGQFALWYSPKIEFQTVFRIAAVIALVHLMKLVNRFVQSKTDTPYPTQHSCGCHCSDS